jgi:hypothetical protein
MMFGGTPPVELRDRVRAAAFSGTPDVVKLQLKPLSPDPRVPTFDKVRR